MKLFQGIFALIALSCAPLALWLKGMILLGTLKIIACIIFIIFGFIPVIFRYVYPIQRSLIFLNFVNLPPNTNYNSPKKYGISGTRNLYITTDKNVTLGMWHTLPASLLNPADVYGDNFFEESLSHGEPVFVYMHGNSGSRASQHRIMLYNLLRNLNCHVIAFDYRSYADSSAVSPTEEGVVDDSTFVYKWVKERAKSAPVFVWGHSLGTGVSSHMLDLLADEGIHPKGLVLESPFNNLRDEIREHPFAKFFRLVPWFDFFFIDPVAQNKLLFQTDRHLANVQAPILILHSEDDMIIPIRLAEKLHKSLIVRPKDAGQVELVKFKAERKYGHKYICTAPELPQIIKKFISESISV